MNRRIVFTPRQSYAKKLRAIFGSSLIGLWPLDESSGTVAFDKSGSGRNGTYSGLALASTTGPKGGMAPLLDTNSDDVLVYSTSLASAFNGAAGTISIFGKVSAVGVWTDGVLGFIMNFAVDSNNYVRVLRSATNNVMTPGIRLGGATAKSVNVTVGPGIGWFQIGLTWSTADDAMIAYYNGAPSGSTQTSIGTWSGTVVTTQCALGSQGSSSTSYWNGYIAYGILLNRVATAAEMLQVYNLT